MELSTDTGLVVDYSSAYIAKVTLPVTFKNKVTGFCGNFDDSVTNDLRLKDGTSQGVTANMVGDSYIVDSSDIQTQTR